MGTHTVPGAPPCGEPQGSQALVQWVQGWAFEERGLGRDAPLFQAAPHHSAWECEWLMFTESLWGAGRSPGARSAPLYWHGGQGSILHSLQSSSRAGVHIYTTTRELHTREGHLLRALPVPSIAPFSQSCPFPDGSVSEATTQL